MAFNDLFQQQIHEFARSFDNGQGRTLEELIGTDEILKGAESQRLRTFCTSECMIPARDLDKFGELLLMGPLSLIEQDFESRTARILESQGPDSEGGTSVYEATQQVCDDLFKLRWGPTRVPIFNLLGLFRILNPDQKTLYFDIARFFISQGVPVNGKDLSGTTALSHSFSTKPASDFDYAQLLYDTGGDVNHRNRYGGVVVHEIVTVYPPFSSGVKKTSVESLKWFLSHGGNVDIADSDGMVARSMCERLQAVFPELMSAIKREDQRRKLIADSSCALCGMQNAKLLLCARCRKSRYCSPQQKACQKLDWPRHKKTCKSPTSWPLTRAFPSFRWCKDIDDNISHRLSNQLLFVNQHYIIVYRYVWSAVHSVLRGIHLNRLPLGNTHCFPSNFCLPYIFCGAAGRNGTMEPLQRTAVKYRGGISNVLAK